jgi:hypothetical protein
MAIETLAGKLGVLLVSLGAMHFFNMYLFHRIRRRAKIAELPPPVLPHQHVAPRVAESASGPLPARDLHRQPAFPG